MFSRPITLAAIALAAASIASLTAAQAGMGPNCYGWKARAARAEARAARAEATQRDVKAQPQTTDAAKPIATEPGRSPAR